MVSAIQRFHCKVLMSYKPNLSEADKNTRPWGLRFEQVSLYSCNQRWDHIKHPFIPVNSCLSFYKSFETVFAASAIVEWSELWCWLLIQILNSYKIWLIVHKLFQLAGTAIICNWSTGLRWFYTSHAFPLASLIPPPHMVAANIYFYYVTVNNSFIRLVTTSRDELIK